MSEKKIGRFSPVAEIVMYFESVASGCGNGVESALHFC